jgi:DNA-binding XRE family transcriptional regulator
MGSSEYQVAAITQARQSNPKNENELFPQNSAETVQPIETRVELAKIAGVSHDTISKVERIEERGTDEQKAQLRTGEATINEVFKSIKKDERRESTLARETTALEAAGGDAMEWDITAAQKVNLYPREVSNP